MYHNRKKKKNKKQINEILLKPRHKIQLSMIRFDLIALLLGIYLSDHDLTDDLRIKTKKYKIMR